MKIHLKAEFIQLLIKWKAFQKRLGFEIVTCYTQETNTDLETVEQRVKKCFRELGKKADAIYVTALLGVNKKRFRIW